METVQQLRDALEQYDGETLLGAVLDGTQFSISGVNSPDAGVIELELEEV